jgi:DNA repair protein RAD7
MNNEFTDSLCSMPPLRVLDLAFPGIGIDEDGWMKIIEKHGSTLETLDASKHEGFTDDVLQESVREYTRVLFELKLEGCLSLTDEGVAQFFDNWAYPISALKDEDRDMDVDSDAMEVSLSSLEPFTPNPPLRILSLARNQELSSAALAAAIVHSAQSLTWLNVNGLRSASSEALVQLKRAKELRYLDAGWCRELDDFVMKDVVTACTKLNEIKVWGCNRIRGVGWGVKVSQVTSFMSSQTDLVLQRPIKVHGIEPSGGM